MSDEMTPAIERLAEKQFRDYESEYSTDGMTVADFHHSAHADLTVALDVEEISDALATSRHYGVRLKPDQANYLARVIRTALLGADS